MLLHLVEAIKLILVRIKNKWFHTVMISTLLYTKKQFLSLHQIWEDRGKKIEKSVSDDEIQLMNCWHSPVSHSKSRYLLDQWGSPGFCSVWCVICYYWGPILSIQTGRNIFHLSLESKNPWFKVYGNTTELQFVSTGYNLFTLKF